MRLQVFNLSAKQRMEQPRVTNNAPVGRNLHYYSNGYVERNFWQKPAASIELVIPLAAIAQAQSVKADQMMAILNA